MYNGTGGRYMTCGVRLELDGFMDAYV